MILFLYISRRFLVMTGIVALAFFGILLLIDMIEQLRRFSRAGASLAEIFVLSLMHVPETFYRILPLLVIIGAITLFLALARSSELVVIRGAGCSGLRFLRAPVAVAFLIGIVSVAVLNPLVAGTIRAYDDLRARYIADNQSVLSISDSGLWLRQGDPDGQTVIQAHHANFDGTRLSGVMFLTFDQGGMPVTRVHAGMAELISGGWKLKDARFWNLTAENPEQDAADWADGTMIPSDLTPEKIRDGFGTPTAVPIWQLPSYIRDLEQAGFTARSYRLWLQMELALPFLFAAMVLVAACFTMRHVRSGRAALRTLYAVLAGFTLFFLRNFAQALGDSGQIPIILAAWTPPIVALLLALGFLLHLEEG